ncbi:MAG TPA: hypothetical protein VMS32_04690 [Verrucomicrobiae bacterium]|jgi:hypothetical protein|nr:hypothetical protein [Verrucomicrobiae bacterium]
MSKEKSAPAKKALSLQHDRRNVYGESPHASRKNIPRGKQRSHQHERRAVSQELGGLGVSPDDDMLVAVESAAKTVARAAKRKAFRKTPDEPLAKVLADKQRRVPSPRAPAVRTRIMYVESKADGLVGPARIGRVSLSKTGRTVYYRGRAFQRFKGYKANYFDTGTFEEYWVSGPRKDGNDRLYAGGPPVHIDDDVRDEYWAVIRKRAPARK